jgi:hypothetical protein
VASQSDHSLGLVVEATFGTPAAPDHFYEWLESSKLDTDPNVINSKGLRVGSRFPRASRRVGLVPKPDGKLNFELASKGFGVALQAALGTAVWTAITGGGQVLATATTTGTTLPSFAAQEGLVRADGTVVAHTWRGCTVKSCEFSQGLDGFLELSLGVDAKAMHVTRTVSDGATTTGSATFGSTTGAFATSDVGAPISATGIPAATTILSVTSATAVTMSANATATGTALAATIGQSYATPTYPASATLYSSAANPVLANVVLGGTLTVPTTTALASIAGGTTVAGCKSWGAKLDNGTAPRDAIGHRNQPTTGQRSGTVEAVVEYDATTGLLLERYMIDKTPFPLLLSAQTSEVIGSGYATFQLALPSVAIDSGAIPQPTSKGVASTALKMSVLDGEVAAQQLYAAYQTADTAL